MNSSYWHKQSNTTPLFPSLDWSRPESRHLAGKLLVVGGSLHAFAAPAEAYTQAVKAGIGTTRVLLPDALRRTVGQLLETGEFAPSTPSGSFGASALAELLDCSAWADATLVAGDLGRNAETAILLERFLAKQSAAVTLTKDAIDYAVSTPGSVLHRPDTLLVPSLSQLRRLGMAAGFEQPVQFSMDLLRLVDWLHAFTQRFAPYIITQHLDTLFVAVGGQVSTTRLDSPQPVWRVRAAATAAVWWLQHPSKPFDSLTTAAYHSCKSISEMS